MLWQRIDFCDPMRESKVQSQNAGLQIFKGSREYVAGGGDPDEQQMIMWKDSLSLFVWNRWIRKPIFLKILLSPLYFMAFVQGLILLLFEWLDSLGSK